MSSMSKKQTIIFILVIVVALYVGQYVANQIIYGETNKTDNMTDAEKANQLGRQINCMFWGKWNGTDCEAK
jgi:hypothetical protein